MPTTFAADWTKAKAAFTSATQAKKPSASFLGVFNKGTGIASSLKKTRFETLHNTYAAYLENYNQALKIHEGLAEDYKNEVADLIAAKSSPPPVFSDSITTELKKKPGRRAIDVKAEEVDAAGSRLNPRVLEVRAATLSKISVQLVAFTTAALKAHEEGVADGAKANLANAHKELDKMEAIVDPIQQDYEAQKQAVAESKVSKDIMQKLNKITAIHKKAIQTVNEA